MIIKTEKGFENWELNKKEITSKKLSTNCISDDMLQLAIEKGYKLPDISIKRFYGQAAEFIAIYTKGIITRYEMNILRPDGLAEYMFGMNV